MQPIATSGERRATLAELEVEARRAAAAMAAAGVEEGDSVALCLRNDLPFISAAEAASLIGAYSVPVNWHFTAEETGYILADCGAKVVLVHSDLWPRIREVVPAGVEVVLVETPAEIRRAYDLPDEDPADPEGRPRWDDWVAAHGAWAAEEGVTRGSMIYTSGTTGRPKGVRREPATPEQQQNTLAMASSGFGVRPGVVGAITGPLYHSAPMAYMRLLYGMGCDIHLLPRFDAAGLLADIERLGLRVRPETLCRITEFSEHESNGREFDEGERVAVEVLPVLGQSAAAVEPGDGAFDHPTPGLDDEALHPIGSLDDLGLEIGQDAGQGAVKDRPLIGRETAEHAGHGLLGLRRPARGRGRDHRAALSLRAHGLYAASLRDGL